MMFEVMDLAVASPATVSRCGMVYLEPSILGLQPYVNCYLKTLPDAIFDHKNKLQSLFDGFLEVITRRNTINWRLTPLLLLKLQLMFLTKIHFGTSLSWTITIDRIFKEREKKWTSQPANQQRKVGKNKPVNEYMTNQPTKERTSCYLNNQPTNYGAN